MIRKTIRQIFLAFGIVALSGSITAADVAAPSGPVILTISGEISTTNAEDALKFDRASLMALEPATIKTSTIWTEGVHEFQGVSLKTLVDLIGVTEGTILATAINDYSVEIPVTDAVEGGALVAYQMDGKEMSVREKGPLWVVYPYDSDADFRSEVIYSRSIWQLDRLKIVQ